MKNYQQEFYALMIKVSLFVWAVYHIRIVGTPTQKELSTGAGLITMVLKNPVAVPDSDYGRTINIKPIYDPRLFPPVPRNSAAFKTIFKCRTSVERSNKRILVDYNIENGRCRSSKQRFVRATLAVVNIHLDTWPKHTAFSIMSFVGQAEAVA
jgi:hypothetical protein